MTLKCIIEGTLKSLHTEQFHLYNNMEKAKLKGEKSVAAWGRGREEDWLQRDLREHFEMMEMFCTLIAVVVTWLCLSKFIDDKPEKGEF